MQEYFSHLLTILVGILPVVVLTLGIRTHRVIAFRLKRVDEIYERNAVALQEGWFMRDFAREYLRLPSFKEMEFNFRCWTYRQFFPQPLYWHPNSVIASRRILT